MAEKRTGRPVGRPSNVEKAERARLEVERLREARTHPGGRHSLPKLGPAVPKGLGWGGARVGSGRPRGKTAARKMVMIRLDAELETKLSVLPEGARSEYIRKAIDLMVTISPPEKFRASVGSGEPETPSETPSKTPSEAQT